MAGAARPHPVEGEDPHRAPDGRFDFLGYHVKHYKVRTTATGYKLLITPSKDAVARVRAKMRDECRHLRGANALAVIKRLNPVIRGWAHYHRVVVASRSFRALDEWMFRREVRYVKRTHPTKSRDWMRERYWGRLNKERADHWAFGDKRTGAYLLKFRWFKIERHALVKGTASPDDAGLKDYWVARNASKAKDLTPSRQKIAKNQNHVCPICGESLFNEEETQLHHREPWMAGGEDRYGNFALLHLYCHQQIHRGQQIPEPRRKSCNDGLLELGAGKARTPSSEGAG